LGISYLRGRFRPAISAIALKHKIFNLFLDFISDLIYHYTKINKMAVIGTVGAGRFQRDIIVWCEIIIPNALKIIHEFDF
jgi:hypothetical protein